MQDIADLSPYALAELYDYLLIFQDEDALGLSARLEGDRLAIMSRGVLVGRWRWSGTSLVFEGEPPTCVCTLQAAVLHTLSALAVPAAVSPPAHPEADAPPVAMGHAHASV